MAASVMRCRNHGVPSSSNAVHAGSMPDEDVEQRDLYPGICGMATRRRQSEGGRTDSFRITLSQRPIIEVGINLCSGFQQDCRDPDDVARSLLAVGLDRIGS